MTRKRLTREENRDQTRGHLVGAARILIAKKGLSAVSVEDIADAAGYTRGAFYSNFASKEDLLIEILRRDQQKMRAGFRALRDELPRRDPVQSHIRALYTQMYVDNQSFMNWTEARVFAARDAKFRTKVNALLTERLGDVADMIDFFYRLFETAPPVPAMVLAMGFTCLLDGMQLSAQSSAADSTARDTESVLTSFFNSIQ